MKPKQTSALPAMPPKAKVVKGDLVVNKGMSFKGATYVQGNVVVDGVLEETVHTDSFIATGSIKAKGLKCGGTIYAGKGITADVVFVELEGRLGAIGGVKANLAILEDEDCAVEGKLIAKQKVVLSLHDGRPLKKLEKILAPYAFGLLDGHAEVFDYSNLLRTIRQGKPWSAAKAPKAAVPVKTVKRKKTDSSHYTRRFECKKGSSSTFWEIELDGETMITRWGRIGTTGRRATKKFSGWANSTYAATQLIHAKKKEGYKETKLRA